jgi:hypothetical protein
VAEFAMTPSEYRELEKARRMLLTPTMDVNKSSTRYEFL